MSRGQRDQRQSRQTVEQKYQPQLIFRHAVGSIPERRIYLHEHQYTGDDYCENHHRSGPVHTFLLKVVFTWLGSRIEWLRKILGCEQH